MIYGQLVFAQQCATNARRPLAMRRTISLLALFVICTGLSLAVFAPRSAHAVTGVRAVSIKACSQSGNTFTCGFPSGSDLPNGSLIRAYFDYTISAAAQVHVGLIKS